MRGADHRSLTPAEELAHRVAKARPRNSQERRKGCGARSDRTPSKPTSCHRRLEACLRPDPRVALPRPPPPGHHRNGRSRRIRCDVDGGRRSHVPANAGTLQPRADGWEAHGIGQTGKRSDGWASGRESARSGEGELSGYVTSHVTHTPSELALCLYLLDLNGGRDRTRTCDLLRVKQAL